MLRNYVKFVMEWKWHCFSILMASFINASNGKLVDFPLALSSTWESHCWMDADFRWRRFCSSVSSSVTYNLTIAFHFRNQVLALGSHLIHHRYLGFGWPTHAKNVVALELQALVWTMHGILCGIYWTLGYATWILVMHTMRRIFCRVTKALCPWSFS